MSRIQVREALRQLESEGLVTIRPNSWSPHRNAEFDECAEIYEMRERLEPLALSQSIGRLSDEQLQKAAALSTRLDDLVDNMPAWLAADRQFHLA